MTMSMAVGGGAPVDRPLMHISARSSKQRYILQSTPSAVSTILRRHSQPICTAEAASIGCCMRCVVFHYQKCKFEPASFSMVHDMMSVCVWMQVQAGPALHTSWLRCMSVVAAEHQYMQRLHRWPGMKCRPPDSLCCHHKHT